MIEIPNRCEVTIKHAMTHIQSAKAARYDDDLEQLVHDLDIAAAILNAIADANRLSGK